MGYFVGDCYGLNIDISFRICSEGAIFCCVDILDSKFMPFWSKELLYNLAIRIC